MNNNGYITKDSGERVDYKTGARRDTEKGKPRLDLIDPLFIVGVNAALHVFADSGIMPLDFYRNLIKEYRIPSIGTIQQLHQFPVEVAAKIILSHTEGYIGVASELDFGTYFNRTTLIPSWVLRRLGELMGRGAEKYGDNNWRLGIPSDRFARSFMRHLISFLEGEQDEDHFSACLFNLMALHYNWLVSRPRRMLTNEEWVHSTCWKTHIKDIQK